MDEHRTGTPGVEVQDQFLSEDDLSLLYASLDDVIDAWNEWFELAQSTNEFDKDDYSHSAFLSPKLWAEYGIDK